MLAQGINLSGILRWSTPGSLVISSIFSYRGLPKDFSRLPVNSDDMALLIKISHGANYISGNADTREPIAKSFGLPEDRGAGLGPSTGQTRGG